MASALLQRQQTNPLGTCPQSLSAMPKACGLRYLALLILEAWIFMPAGSTSSSSRWRSPSALGPGVDCRQLVLSLSTDRDIAAIGREKLERLEEKLKAETRQTSPSEVAPSRLKALQSRQATNQELSSRQVEADKRGQLGGPQNLARASEKDTHACPCSLQSFVDWAQANSSSSQSRRSIGAEPTGPTESQ